MKSYCTQLLGLSLIILSVSSAQQYSQDYQDYADGYQQDNLYADYAMRQQEKAVGGGGGFLKTALIGGVSWFLGGKFHSNRASKSLKKKFLKESKSLYSQYYNDVYKLQEQNAELAYVIEQLQTTLQKVEEEREMEAIQRDYDEFKQPDLDGDDRISRAEFNMYVKNYLSNYPGLSERDYPRFEDFDHDKDGYVSFQEYTQQMALQAKKAEQEKMNAQTQAAAQKAGYKANALKGLSGDAIKSDSFNDLYASYRK